MKTIFFAIIIVLLVPAATSAQDTDCSAIRAEALATAQQACAAVESNTICYGHAAVKTVVNCENAPAFESPGDTLPLNASCAVRLSAQPESGAWGVAVMKVRPADADQDITLVAYGDAELHNAASGFVQQAAVALGDTEIYSQPAPPYDAISQIAEGETIEVDACNCTGHWLRTVLDDGRVGWLLARNVQMPETADALPVVTMDTPIFQPMQAFTFRSGEAETTCSGLLVQVPAGVKAVPLQINGVEMLLSATVFIQSQPGNALTFTVIDGLAQVTANDFTVNVPAGARAVIPLSADNTASGIAQVEVYNPESVAPLPVSLLPEVVQATQPDAAPVVVGVEACVVRSDRGETTCPLHFINPDGDPITRMDIEFVKAPHGEWEGAVIESPVLLSGDMTSGVLPWKATCSVGSAIFIGPVEWAIRLTDSQGHTSEPFAASFNCVDG